MRRFLRWTGFVVAGLLAVVVLASGFLYVQSERVIRRTYERPTRAALVIPTDSASIAEGERLARIRGCMDGCHGPGASGGVFMDDPLLARLIAPNLTRIVHSYSAEQLDAAIRGGVRPDGRSVWIMPSDMFKHLTDEDLGRILAFLRMLPQSDGYEREMRPGPLARIGIATRKFQPASEYIAVSDVPPPAVTAIADLGRYLALTSCTECHGPALVGYEPLRPGDPPPLSIVAAYSAEAFARLMSEGVPLDGRELGLMRDVALGRFSHFTDDDVAALYEYLRTLGQPAS